MRKIVTAGILGAFTATIAGCVSPGYNIAPVAPTPRAVHATAAAVPGGYLGVFEKGIQVSYRPAQQFASAVGRRPNILLYYSGWYERFQLAFAQRARIHGAIPFVQMQPSRISMSGIAAGRYDSYLRSYASQVRSFGHPVMIGFAHEMNGGWYSWGYRHVSPSTWVAAWRHVVDVFRAEGAENVIWTWTPNCEKPGMPPLRDYWPGGRYVTWVGIDGYLETPAQTFKSVFVPTITAIRGLTKDPIILAETAVGPASGQAAKIPGMFAGIRTDHLLGMVWFDRPQHNGIYHQDWHLEDNSTALAVFRREVASFFK